MPPRQARGGAAAATARLQEQIAAGDSYEALQTARALYSRYAAQGKEGQALDLVLAVAKTFAEAGEAKSALDLARLYMADNTTNIKVQEVDGAAPPADAAAAHRYTSGGRDNIIQLSRLLPPGPEKVSILKGLSRWGAEETKDIDGEVNVELADALKAVGDYGGAAQRLASADEGAAGAYVQLLADWAPKGYPSERDLFVARAVLHLLVSRGGANYARAVATAAQVHPEFQAAVANSPIFHFALIALDLVQFRHRQGSQQAYRHLCAHYEASLGRDPELGRVLQQIGEAYFAFMPPPNPMANLLSMFGGGAM